MNWEQTVLFDAGPEPHARMTDPVSSHLTIDSLGRDTSYNWRIFEAIIALSERTEFRHYDDGDSIAVIHDHPVTDDDIVEWMERRYQRRFQRNVVARQRGIVHEMGWLKRVDDVIGNTGRQTIAHIPTSAGLTVWREAHS